jgi:hypothetical protein
VARSADGPALLVRARFVVQLLELCPELSRGTHALALLLLQDADLDLDRFAAAIDAACRRDKEQSRRNGLTLGHHAWSSGWPLSLDGEVLGQEGG